MYYLLAGTLGFLLCGAWFGTQLWLKQLFSRRGREGLIPFAPLLAGGDDGDTDRRTEEFRAAYQASLAEDVKSRLPASAPVVTAPLPQRPRRGIRRLR